MAGKNRTNAWNSVEFIKTHLPLWEKRGMTKGFLDSIIETKYKGCAIDVASAITCDTTNFVTAYNQPDFIEKFKAICKQYKMPYGKVKSEVIKAVEEDVAFLMLSTYGEFVKPKRIDGEKELGFKDIAEHINKLGYKLHKLENINQVLDSVNVQRTAGDKKLTLNKLTVSLLISMSRDKLDIPTMYKIARLKEKSLQKYYRVLEKAGLGKMSKNKRSPEMFILDYSKVRFEDSFVENRVSIEVNSLFEV